jgi:hypothetical protein
MSLRSISSRENVGCGGADAPFWEPGFDSGATPTPASKRIVIPGLGKCPVFGSINCNDTGLPILALSITP